MAHLNNTYNLSYFCSHFLHFASFCFLNCFKVTLAVKQASPIWTALNLLNNSEPSPAISWLLTAGDLEDWEVDPKSKNWSLKPNSQFVVKKPKDTSHDLFLMSNHAPSCKLFIHHMAENPNYVQRLCECDFKSLYGQKIAVDIKDRLWEAVRASVSVESDPSLEFSAGIWI